MKSSRVLGIAVERIFVGALRALILSLVTLRLERPLSRIGDTGIRSSDRLSAPSGSSISPGGPSGMVGIPSFSIGSFAFDTPISMYYLVIAVNAVLAAPVFSARCGRASGGRFRPYARTRWRQARSASTSSATSWLPS